MGFSVVLEITWEFDAFQIDQEIHGIEIFAPIFNFHYWEMKLKRVTCKQESIVKRPRKSFVLVIHLFSWVQVQVLARKCESRECISGEFKCIRPNITTQVLSVEHQSKTCWFCSLFFRCFFMLKWSCVIMQSEIASTFRLGSRCSCSLQAYGIFYGSANIIRAIYFESHQLTTPASVFGHCASTLGPDSTIFFCWGFLFARWKTSIKLISDCEYYT